MQRKDSTAPVEPARSASLLAPNVASAPLAPFVEPEVVTARAARRALLVEAGRLLDASFDPATTLPKLARLVVPELADFCIIDVVEPDDTVKRLAVAHVEARGEEILRELARYAQLERHLAPLREVFESATPLFLPELDDELLAIGGSDPVQRRLRGELAARSWITVPLVGSGPVLGALTLGHSTSGRRHDATDVALAGALARRVALAIEHARLVDAAQRAARARDEILHVVANELRNPLGTIHRAARALDELVAPEQSMARKQLATLLRASERLQHLVDDLLGAQRAEARGADRPRSVPNAYSPVTGRPK